MRRLSSMMLMAVAVSVTACGGKDTQVVAPTVQTCPAAAVPLCTDATGAAAVRAAITDAVTRLRPSLGTAATAAIGTELTTFKTALDAGNVSAARTSALALRASIATLRGTGALSPDLVTLDALTLAIIRAQVALGVTPVQLTVANSDTSDTR
jgi:hypothetical protein